MEDEINIAQYFMVVWRHKLLIVLVTIMFAVVGYIYSLSLTATYKASASLFIRTVAVKHDLEIVAPFAGVIGNQKDQTKSADLIAILKSKVLASHVLLDADLRRRVPGWDKDTVKERDLVLLVMKMLKDPVFEDGLLKVEVEYPDSKIATDVANSYVKCLLEYWNDLNVTEAQQKQRYIEGQLPILERKINIIEKKMRLSPTNVSNKLMRDYDIFNSVYVDMKKEYESVKLEQAKELRPFTIVDAAEVPEKPVKIETKKTVLVSAFFGLIVGVFISFFNEYWKKIRNNF